MLIELKNRFLSICFVVLLLMPESTSAWSYIERNSITAGDNSINAIAREQSEIIIAIDSSGNFKRYRSEDVANYVKTNNLSLYEKAKIEFPNQSDAFIEAIAIANFFFDKKEYSSSALMYERALGMIRADGDDVPKLVGLTTASYYGSARHIEGLKFICRQYKNRPKWSFEFRHAIHAHIRSLTVNISHQHAWEALEHVRKNPACRREDFSPIWIPIHLTDMRWLENSIAPKDANYGISKKDDLDFAHRLLEDGNHGFSDYLHFILGNYDEIIENYPNSYLIDLVLLGKGDSEDYNISKNALLEYIKRFPEKGLDAVATLYKRATAEGDLATITSIVEDYGTRLFPTPSTGRIKFQINNHTRVWFPEGEVKDLSLSTILFFSDYYSRCPRLEEMIYSGKFDELLEFSDFFLKKYSDHFEEEKEVRGYFGDPGDKKFKGTCLVELNPSSLRDLNRFVKPLADAYAVGDARQLARIGTNLKLCGDFREGMSHVADQANIRQYCYDITEWINQLNLRRISFHELSALMLMRAYKLDPARGDKSLFLAGLAHRNNSNYEDFYNAMKEFSDYFPDSNLADDAIAEMGWFHLVVRDDPASADRYFQRVTTDYPDSNAYDNALNWLVISKMAQGRYISASNYSFQLLAEISSDRLSLKISDRHVGILQTQSAIKAGSKIKMARVASSTQNFFGLENSIHVSEVSDSGHVINSGDRIYKVDGKFVNDPAEAYRILSNLRTQGESMVSVDFYSANLDEFKSGVLVAIADFGV